MWLSELWWLCHGSADCENRIKELKYDFEGEHFNLRDFRATEAALLTMMLAYNLMRLFRQRILRSDAVSGKADVRHTLPCAISALPRLLTLRAVAEKSGCPE